MIKPTATYGIRISERMVGSIQLNVAPQFPNQLNSQFGLGEKYPFDFSIHAFSNFSLSYPFSYQFKGHCHLPGFPIGQELVQEMKRPQTQGIMSLSAKGVAYDLTVNLPGHGPVRIRGTKIYTYNPLSWKAFRKGLTVLVATVECNNQIIGQVEMLYPLSLWHFPLGVRICSGEFAYRPNLKLARKLFQLVPDLFPDYRQLGTDEEIIFSIEDQLNHSRFVIRLAVCFSNAWIQICRLFNSGNRSPLLIPVIGTILTSLFSSKSFLEAKGQNKVEIPRSFENEKWMALCHGPSTSLSSEEIECDVVVLGSGAGGAALASSLAKKGFAVSVIEEGDFFKRQDLTGFSTEMVRKLYRNQGMDLFISNSPIWVPTGKCVGGTTFINSGTCVKTPPELIEKWRRASQDKDFDLGQYFSVVEKQLGFNRVPENLCGGIAKVLEKGLEGVPCHFGPLHRAEIGCDGQAACVLGCPSGAKRSTAVSFIPEALKGQAHLFSPFRAEEIIFNGTRAVGLKCHVEGFGKEFEVTFKAKAVVVAAGTFGTPALLHRSGISRKKIPAMGRYLTIHPALTIGGIFDQPVRETLFVPQSMGIFDLGHSDYICEGYTLPVDVIASAMLQWGDELKCIMDRIENFSNFSSMLKDVTYGEIIFTPFGPVPSYFLDQRSKEILKHSACFISKIFLNAGAEKIYVPIHGHRVLKNQRDLDSLSSSNPRYSDFLLSAHHPLGTCRMGNNASDSVTDWNGKVHGYEGLYVCDGSAIPGPLGVNPQVTIMANALRIADHIAGNIL